jgi:hypothetical protein
VAGCCECGDEPSVSGATELVNGSERFYLLSLLCRVSSKCDRFALLNILNDPDSRSYRTN